MRRTFFFQFSLPAAVLSLTEILEVWHVLIRSAGLIWSWKERKHGSPQRQEERSGRSGLKLLESQAHIIPEDSQAVNWVAQRSCAVSPLLEVFRMLLNKAMRILLWPNKVALIWGRVVQSHWLMIPWGPFQPPLSYNSMNLLHSSYTRFQCSCGKAAQRQFASFFFFFF